MFLEKAAFSAGLSLCRFRSTLQSFVEVPSEQEEDGHERKYNAGEFEIQYEHGPNNEDRIEDGLESIRHKARSQFRHLIDILLHSVQFFSDGCSFVVVRREAVQLFQDAKSNSEDEILNRSKAY